MRDSNDLASKPVSPFGFNQKFLETETGNVYSDIGVRATHDCRDAEGRATPGALAEDA